MIRFCFVALFLIIYLVLGIPVLGLLWLLKKINPKAADYISLRMVQYAFRFFLFLSGVSVTVIGEDRIPEEAALFVGNHRSYFDILLTYSRCRRLTGFVAKKEMLRYPLLRTWMKRLYCLFLDRDNPREGLKTILTAIEQVKQGNSIFIFPEGTRNRQEEGSLLPFHSGSFKIAEKSGCPIVPVTLNHTAAIFEQQFPKIRPTSVVLEYGDPIYLDRLTPEERKNISTSCQALIQETLIKNGSLAK